MFYWDQYSTEPISLNGGRAMKAIRVHEPGGPDKLIYEDVPAPSPGPGQVLVKIRAIGLNYIDVYFRTGLYKAPMPFIPGMEAAGTIETVAEDIKDLKPGDRVAYAGVAGAYAEYAIVNGWQVAKLPDALDFNTGAALMLQGMTAHYLANSAFPLKSGDIALIHAAAGGVGLLLIQIAKRNGAKVIGTVSTEEKAILAATAGADHIILYTQMDFEKEVKMITDGIGVDVVYDSVGRTTFDKGLNCLRRRGTMVLFGQSSGPVPTFDLTALNQKGSLYVTRPGLPHYTASRDELLWRSGEVMKWTAEKNLDIRIDRIYPLKEAAQAHRALESRETAGKVLLLP
jgi:NADPH:quinone reductase